jgi:murein DD-endopeptidase MepM/ murein hydrolase activator NlpD
LPNAKDGVQRALGRLRPLDRNRSLTVRRLHRRAVGITRGIVDRLVPVPTRRPEGISQVAPRHLASHRDIVAAAAAKAPGHGPVAVIHFLAGLHPHWRGASRLRLQRRLLKVRLGSERALPMGIAMAVIVAGVVSLSGTAVHPVGAAQGNSQQLRIAVGGSDGGTGDPKLADNPTLASGSGLSAYVDDGTFYKPVAVDTVVESGSSLLRHYTVRSGDTLTGIASSFGVSMMTLWWANKLSSKDSLHQGQTLTIPPVNGLVITVAAGDTLEALGTQYNVDPQAIMDLNNLSDPLLVVGQVLILPGATGAPIPVPAKPVVVRKYSTSSGSRTYVYTSGSWAWPVPGGYISQYFHYGHYGVDIADQWGSPIIAARGGTIVYAGWNSNGCGYEVRIYIGSNLYIQNCHMASVGVHAGQVVSKGQFIGRVGMSGNATGPHDHFAVSVGEPFTSGAYFVNPLNYF